MPKKSDKAKDSDISSNLVQSLVALPLLEEMDRLKRKNSEGPVDIIIDLNLIYAGGDDPSALEAARKQTLKLIDQICGSKTKSLGVDRKKTRFGYQHVFARMKVSQIKALAELIEEKSRNVEYSLRPVHKIWLDAEISGHLTKSVATVKGDASLVSFGASGQGIVWAVLDSGIAGDHPHFRKHKNLEVCAPLKHMDFTGGFNEDVDEDVLCDPNGHGTHVAGIIAGEHVQEEDGLELTVVYRRRDESNEERCQAYPVERIRGVAPRCKLLNLRVLDENGKGKESNILAALGYVYKLNASSRWPLVHGVNLSVGYEFKAEWFACGQSPLCTEVDRLVRSGTPVVAAAGNTGYGKLRMEDGTSFKSGLALSINDPGNADLAITVGATHREFPHTYGVSYFSSKGPTGDGRLKPDLVAPGERLVSCAAGARGMEMARAAGIEHCHYREESGTSMAAPHVSGAVAAFLSIRNEFIGRPERVKELFLSTCTDLGRERYFQGHGLLDLMRAIQSI